jgi:hypothetical protein
LKEIEFPARLLPLKYPFVRTGEEKVPFGIGFVQTTTIPIQSELRPCIHALGQALSPVRFRIMGHA